MKQLIVLLLLIPFMSAAQNKPRFVNDTLYTSCGYKIYQGQMLHFGKGSGGRPGKFKHVNIQSDISGHALENRPVIVRELKHFGISILGNGYISITGSITFKDGSKGNIIMHMAFDHAIGKDPQIPGELIVPQEYKNAIK